jgi:outer membrane protein insertion porin family
VQSQARLSFYEPDLFGTHLDTVGLKLDAYRSFRQFESYSTDIAGGSVALDHRFGREFSAVLAFRNETVDIERIEFDAPTIVWDNEGSTEIRAIRFSFNHDSRDRRLLTSSGIWASVYGEYGGGFLGAETDFVKLGTFGDFYVPLYRDSKARPYVLYLSSHLDWVQEFDDTPDVHPNERLYMGGQNSLRGFDYRSAGPSQFGNPTGGKARWLGTMEIQFPIFSVRPEDETREVEIMRGALFTDAGLLGLSFSDPTFEELRLAVGIGLRIRVPGLGFLPIALDFAHPVFFEETDDRRAFHFRLGAR